MKSNYLVRSRTGKSFLEYYRGNDANPNPTRRPFGM